MTGGEIDGIEPSADGAIIMSKKKLDDAEEPSFEESLAELDQIVAKLEGGKLPLADALAAYELGVKRLAGCYRTLREAERRIQLVERVDASGAAQVEPFDDDGADDEDLSEKSAARSRRRTAKGLPRPAGRVDDDTSLF